MGTIPPQISPFKKVLLATSISNMESQKDSRKTPHHMEFIFGVGMNGLTHFECMLEGKQMGCEIVFQVKNNDLMHYFAHLYRLLPGFSDDAAPVFFKVVVKDISEPTDREIVKSLAEAASCGTDCGCGCGSH